MFNWWWCDRALQDTGWIDQYKKLHSQPRTKSAGRKKKSPKPSESTKSLDEDNFSDKELMFKPSFRRSVSLINMVINISLQNLQVSSYRRITQYQINNLRRHIFSSKIQSKQPIIGKT